MNFHPFHEVRYGLINSLRCSAVCGLFLFFRQNIKLKPSSYGSGASGGPHSTHKGTRRSKQFARARLNWAIRHSYHSEHSANRLTASWPNIEHVSLRDRERHTETEKEGLLVVAVMLSKSLPQCCVLLLCISHCFRPSLSRESSVSPETPASLLECPGGNSTPRRAAVDGHTPSPSTLITFLVPSSQDS